MRIAVVGAGIAGLYVAWHLARDHEVTLFEAADRPGGHADTHEIDDEGRRLAIDSGFIVFNRSNYPLFSAWLDQLGVASQPSDMSFSVSSRPAGLEYSVAGLSGLFSQHRNLLRPAFWRMFLDIVRFYHQAPDLLAAADHHQTLGQWLSGWRCGRLFASHHLLPMASALWSLPTAQVADFPLSHLLTFMDNHAMLTLRDRPRWLTVAGGSQSYVMRAVATMRAEIEPGTPVQRIIRRDDGVQVHTPHGHLDADAVVLACHTDQALAMIEEPSVAERQVLSSIAYQPNEVLLHEDTSVLPRDRRAWASWNVLHDAEPTGECLVSYYMNRLQGLSSRRHFIVSLNQADRIDPDRVLARRSYQHPVFTPAAVAAQRRWHEINGHRRTWYCGAWWGWGFHEDGARSAQRVVDAIVQ